MVVHAVAVVAALADALDLVDLAVADQVVAMDVVAVVAAQADVKDLVLALVDVDVLAVVQDARADVKDAVDVQGVEVLVQAHVHLVAKVPHVLHAMAVLVALVHARHVHQDAEGVVLGVRDVLAVRDVQGAEVVVETVVETVVEAVLADAREAVRDVQDAALDVTVHALEHATGAVMAVVGNAKTHVQQHAPQHALEPVKLKHLVL